MIKCSSTSGEHEANVNLMCVYITYWKGSNSIKVKRIHMICKSEWWNT